MAVDPIPAAVAALLTAIRAEGPGGQASPLAALLGQDLDLLFQGSTPVGLAFKLPSGQTLTAQGEFPFPPGTELRVRAQAGEQGQVRLQTLEARPPAPPALLAPLAQGEAHALLERLTQGEPAALASLFRRMAGLDATARADTPPPAAASLPDAGAVQRALEPLPAPVRAALAELAGLPATAEPAEIAQALAEGFRRGGGGGVLREKLLPAAAETLAGGSLRPLEAALARHPEVPPAQGSALAQVLRALLGTASAPLPAAPDPGQAETWRTWIRPASASLADPAQSPREAPFHALQAKEGTAFLELPLPWSPSTPLQVWVERDRPDGQGKAHGEGGERVLLGLAFSRLGETRVGLARAGGTLQVRIWAERPGALRAKEADLRAELEALGRPVDLRILDLGPGAEVPTVRSLALGGGLQILG